MARKPKTGNTSVQEEDLEKLAAQVPQRRAGQRADELLPGQTNDDPAGNDIVGAGTPGGGLAAGGMGGTNLGDGSIEESNLENAFGSGIYDDQTVDERDNLIAGQEPQAGPSGGAVGGTPAGKRVKPK